MRSPLVIGWLGVAGFVHFAVSLRMELRAHSLSTDDGAFVEATESSILVMELP